MQDDRRSELFRQPVDLVEERAIVVRVRGGRRDRAGIAGEGLGLEQHLEMTSAPRGLDLGPSGDPPGDAEEPAPDRLPMTDRSGLAHEDQEGGLEGVVGVVRVAQELPADAQDHGPMSFNQDREGGLGGRRIVPRQEPLEELAIGQRAGRTQIVEHGERTAQGGARSWIFHRGSPWSGSGRLSSIAMIKCRETPSRFTDSPELTAFNHSLLFSRSL